MNVTEFTHRIRRRLSELWGQNTISYPSPRSEFFRIVDRELFEFSGRDLLDIAMSDDDESKRLIIRRKYRLNDFEYFVKQDSTLYGCATVEGIAHWIGNDKSFLIDIIKDGYLLYEIELKEGAFVYNLEKQVIFNQNDIVKKSVLHAESTLKEYIK